MTFSSASLAVLLLLTPRMLVSGAQVQQPEMPCNVTLPHNNHVGNEKLYTGLWANGVITFQPGGPGFITSDGALGMKFGWWRGVEGRLRVSGRRLDGVAPPLRLHAPEGYGQSGFQASFLIFPTPGCWQVDAQVGDHADSRITFITEIVTLGAGPSWRLDPETDPR
jgi:hypothetical protein